MLLQARYFWLLAGAISAVLSGVVGGCAGKAVVANGPAPAVPAHPVSSPLPTFAALPSSAAAQVEEGAPRLFPPLEGSVTLSAGRERDGSERLIAYGLRLLARPGGAVELSEQYLPAARAVQSLELPSRLGGGYLFYVLASGASLFFRSQTFTGQVEPFARLDFEAEQVTAGFDRLYVSSRRPDRFVSLDADTGAAVSLGSLPPSPGYSKLAFVDAWFGAVEVPFQGVLVTFDAGASWHPLGQSTATMAVKDGVLRLTNPEGTFDLDRNGTFTRRDPPAVTGGAPSENAVARALRGQSGLGGEGRSVAARAGRNLLKLAVLRGFRAADGSLVVANAGQLLRVRASDGKLLDSDEHAYPGTGECNALSFGHGFGFSCSETGSHTTLYAFVPPFGMQRVRTFSGSRYVASSGNGALVIRGTCTEQAGREAPGAYCVAMNAATFREIHVRGDLGVERVVALADARVAVIVPPRLGAPGFLSLIDGNGAESRVELKLPAASPSNQLLQKGLWLDGFIEQPTGLSGWVVGSEPFAGVRVALDGTVTMSRPEVSIDRSLLSGAHGLIVGRTGRTRESNDGGFEWSDVELPPEFDVNRELHDEGRLQGCSSIGCAFSGFVRVGWRTGSSASRLRVATLPDSTPLLQPGGSRWFLRCEATGDMSEPALPLSSRTRGPSRSDDAQTPPWAAFQELPAPALGAGETGFDVANGEADSPLFHAYAWGERGADWGRAGHLQLRAFDRFQVHHAALQSAVTRSPWADATAAAEAFGFDGNGTPTSWRAVLDAGARSAAVLVSSHGLLDLLLFEDGKTVTRIANAGRLGLSFGMLSSVAKLNDSWYLASFNENHALSVARVTGTRVERLAEYPDVAHDITSAVLVRGVNGGELGVWVASRGWYLYPIDPVRHSVGAPLYQSPADLAAIPPPCSPDAEGFLLGGSPSLEPSLRFPGGANGAEELIARRVEAQFLWSTRGVCTRGLAADTETQVKRTTSAPNVTTSSAGSSERQRAGVPLTVTERRPQGRRWGFVCSRPE
jgi:hypothetical protein